MDLLRDIFFGMVFGIILGSGLSMYFFLVRVDETMSYNELHRDIEHNITIKESTFKKFPNLYKLDYTDWSQWTKKDGNGKRNKNK